VQQSPQAPSQPQQQQQSAQPALRILIAEDNKVNQKVVLKVLQQISGALVCDVVENGLEVLKAMERQVCVQVCVGGGTVRSFLQNHTCTL
jgi:hypothetical protein